MKLFALFALFCVLAYASALPTGLSDEPRVELKPGNEIDGNLEADQFVRLERQPTGDDDDDSAANNFARLEREPQDEPDSQKASARLERFTCDVLSFTSKWVSVNHSACAVKCLFKRRKGGRCRDGVCVCR